MPSLLYELENNEALLLMYIAGELPADDRAEVEQMLSSDGGLRMELEEIRSAMAESMEAISTLDKMEPITASAEAITIRNVSRAMRQWQVDRLRAQPAEPARKSLRYPMWVYPTSAVASILVGVLVWWGITVPTSHDGDVPPDPKYADIQNAAEEKEKTAIFENSFTGEPRGLADAEAQANVLVSRSDDQTSIFPNEPAQ